MGAGRHRRPGIVVARTGPVVQALGVITAGVMLVGIVLALTPGGIGSIRLRSGDPSTQLTSVPSLAPSEAPPAGPGPTTVPSADRWLVTPGPAFDTPVPQAPPSQAPPSPVPPVPTPAATVPPAAPEPTTPEPTTAEPTTTPPEPTPTPTGRPSPKGPPTPLPTPTHRGPGDRGAGPGAPPPAG